MDVKEAISSAKAYLADIYADESISNVGLEEVEYDHAADRWLVTLGLSRPFNTPRTRAQEVIDSINGAAPSLKRMYKVLTLTADGTVVSMKNRESREMV